MRFTVADMVSLPLTPPSEVMLLPRLLPQCRGWIATSGTLLSSDGAMAVGEAVTAWHMSQAIDPARPGRARTFVEDHVVCDVGLGTWRMSRTSIGIPNPKLLLRPSLRCSTCSRWAHWLCANCHVPVAALQGRSPDTSRTNMRTGNGELACTRPTLRML
jgi:hypothetical protein